MKRYVYLLIAILSLAPGSALATISISFDPDTPQVFTGSDINPEITCDVEQNGFWVGIPLSGNKPRTSLNCSNGIYSDAGPNDYSHWESGNSISDDLGGAGTMRFMLVKPATSGDVDCYEVDSTVASCTAATAFTTLGSHYVDYVITEEEEGSGSTASTTASSTPAEVGATAALGALGLFSFISGLGITAWIWTLFLG